MSASETTLSSKVRSGVANNYSRLILLIQS